MTDFYFACGCNGFTILGVLGEASKMDSEEALALAERVIKRAAPKPIIVGVSAPGFAAMRSLSRQVMDFGAAAVMMAPAVGLRPTTRLAPIFAMPSKQSVVMSLGTTGLSSLHRRGHVE